jgi:hypothetical protein
MEEKSNKILEVLLSSASATEILAGKVLGVAMLTLTVLVAWGGIGAVGLLTAFPDTAAMIGDVLLQDGLLAYFAAFMVGGYLMYAVLFAAIGSFCETPRDAQTLMGPIMMVLIIPMFTMQMAIGAPDAPVIRILSMVPFFTPFVMMARLPSDPPMIELIGAIAGMAAFALFMVWVAGRAFRAGGPVGREAQLEELRRSHPGRREVIRTLLPFGGEGGPQGRMRGLLKQDTDRGSLPPASPSSVSLREPPSPPVGRRMHKKGPLRFSGAALDRFVRSVALRSADRPRPARGASAAAAGLRAACACGPVCGRGEQPRPSGGRASPRASRSARGASSRGSCLRAAFSS